MTNEKITALQNEILEVEKRISENVSAREKAAAVLREREEEITGIEKSAPADIAGKIARQREDLAAEVALGTKTAQDAAEFEREIAKAQKRYETEAARQKAVEPIKTAVAGIKRKIAELDAGGKALVAERKAAWGRYLRELAEEAGAEYRAHAEKAFGSLTRVLNLGGILQRLEGVPNGIGAGAREFAIPTLGTESTKLPPEKFSSVGVDTNLFSINSDANLHKHVNSREGDLFEEFEKAGLKWPGPPPASDATPKVHGIAEGIPVSIMRPPDDRFPDGYVMPVEAAHDFDPYSNAPEE